MTAAASALTWGLYEQLMPTEIETIFAHAPVAYLPWGALEYHGKHAAVGLDGLKAHSLCVELAKVAGGLVLPPVYVAANTIKEVKDLAHRRHSLNFKEETLRLLAREHLEQLADEKFRVVFLLAGHVGQPHYDILQDEAQKFNAAQTATKIICTSETDLIAKDIVIVNHAALGEVSFLMNSHPQCIDLARLPKDRVPTLADDAVWGPDPRESSAEKGRVYTKAFVESAKQKIADALGL
ncbi:creatininase family protein [Oleiharenicola lentus]|uniref:creatininase family protein n=1 Tax=Oleiharenicola lentus TaxID=2508720 RepID=UPI003F67680D